MRRYGIMGGSFDPIHLGHLAMADAAMAELKLDFVYFVPAGRPPHKMPPTPYEHRYAMSLLAAADNSRFFVSRSEIERDGYSYTLDTVKYFSGKFPRHEMFFIAGADVLDNLHTWHRYRELLQLCNFAVAERPGFELDGGTLGPTERASLHFFVGPSLAISSTEIRQRLALGKPCRYLLPPYVAAYINKYSLYQDIHL